MGIESGKKEEAENILHHTGCRIWRNEDGRKEEEKDGDRNCRKGRNDGREDSERRRKDEKGTNRGGGKGERDTDRRIRGGKRNAEREEENM